MSTSTQAQPGTAVPARLLSVPLAVTFLAEFTSLTSFFLLLSVMPMLAAAAGAGSSGAGLITCEGGRAALIAAIPPVRGRRGRPAGGSSQAEPATCRAPESNVTTRHPGRPGRAQE